MGCVASHLLPPVLRVLRRCAGSCALLAVAFGPAAVVLRGQESPASVHGLPFTRFFSFEDIGNASRGAHLGFDAYGRIAVIHPGGYVVLNDTTWIDLAARSTSGPPVQRVVFGPNQHCYYGAFGTWGWLETTADGPLKAHSLVPATYPKWVASSNFTEIVATETGAYFSGFNGVRPGVHLDQGAGQPVSRREEPHDQAGRRHGA